MGGGEFDSSLTNTYGMTIPVVGGRGSGVQGLGVGG